MFTQPKMYTAIAKHPTTREIYRKKLIKEELITLEEIERVEATFRSHLDDEFEAAPNYKTNKADWLEGKWEGLSALEGEEEKRDDDTAVELGRLTEIGNSLARVPEEVSVNNKLIRQLKAKSIMMDTGEGIDWAMAEALAYGSLLMEGHPVRLSGQDSGRGTFSHRHAVITDQENENRYFPLSQINPSKQAPFEVMDSPLSEFAVLGYEYGYSLAEPETLTIWEAQFGDFANTAQVIFDQFIASGESKWLRMSGLVMLLPHGMEGQGPEHSSARLERFLQLCAEDNLQVVNITSPANFFHALRRQVKRNFRKPLIVMSPKSLLRHKLNISRLNEMGPGTGFCRIIPEIDTLQEDSEIKRIILCSGKVYFDLLEARRQQNIKDVVIIRVEQLYPWPRGSITEQISKYSNADVVWSQEEPSNQGSWHFVSDRLNYILSNLDQKTKRRRNVIYVGRRASASPATGALKIHNKEQAFLIDQALNGKESDIVQPYIPIK
jgi:2-oxoglutarate dehydrogenase E1 component